jgi:hypothetical protein
MPTDVSPPGSEWFRANALFQTDALALMERIPSDAPDLVFIDPSWIPGPEWQTALKTQKQSASIDYNPLQTRAGERRRRVWKS